MKHTDVSHPDYKPLEKAVENLKEVMRLVAYIVQCPCMHTYIRTHVVHVIITIPYDGKLFCQDFNSADFRGKCVYVRMKFYTSYSVHTKFYSTALYLASLFAAHTYVLLHAWSLIENANSLN